MVHAIPPIRPKHDHRITVLAKVDDKYDWSGITFPVSVDQIETFEENNKVTMNIWETGEDEKTYLTRQGNVLHCQNGMVNLLLIENEEGQAHYIYIKKLERMLHTGTTTYYKDRKFCPSA